MEKFLNIVGGVSVVFIAITAICYRNSEKYPLIGLIVAILLLLITAIKIFRNKRKKRFQI